MLEIGHASRFRSEANALADHLRVHRARDATAIVLCGCCEAAFSTVWGSRGSALCNDLFAQAWDAGGPPRARFEHAVEALIAGFRAQAPILWPSDPSEPFEGSACASFLAILDDGELHVRWMGAQTAILIRARSAIAMAQGHTLHAELRELGHDASAVPPILTRMVSADTLQVPDTAHWTSREGDRIAIVSGEVIQHLSVEEIVDASAEELVELVVARADPFGVVACVATRR